MQAGAPRETVLSRRGRVPCPRCGVPVEIVRMRAHLRDAHQLPSAELETNLLSARRQARRSGRPGRR